MAICKVCGKEVKDDAMFCTGCGAVKCEVCGEFNPRDSKSCDNCENPIMKKAESVPSTKEIVEKYKDDLGVLSGKAQEKVKNAAIKGADAINQFQENRSIQLENNRNDFVTLSDGEELVKRYRATKIKSPKVEGIVSITNKRVIFHGKASGSKIVSEVPIDSVGAIMTYYGTNFKFVQIIIGALLVVLGLTSISDSAIGGLLIAIIGGLLIWLGIKKTFVLSISSSKAMSAPISIGCGTKSIIGNSAALILEADVDVDTELMMHEIGAIILDLQQMGDLAINKWRDK